MADILLKKLDKLVPRVPEPFPTEGDIAPAKLGHINQVIELLNKLVPLYGHGNPYSNSLIPDFIGQQYIDLDNNYLWIGVQNSNWYLLVYD